MYGSVKRFGPRYGRTVKNKLGKIEHEQRKLHECPKCLRPAAKRDSVGIWICTKCGNKFASKAYTVAKPALLKQNAQEV